MRMMNTPAKITNYPSNKIYFYSITPMVAKMPFRKTKPTIFCEMSIVKALLYKSQIASNKKL